AFSAVAGRARRARVSPRRRVAALHDRTRAALREVLRARRQGAAAADAPGGMKLPREFFARDTVAVARDLLGRHLVRKGPGPGLPCRALDIDKRLNGVNLLGDLLWLEEGTPPRRIAKSARIGVDYAGRCAKRPWRFFDRDSAFVSSARRARADIPDRRQSR